MKITNILTLLRLVAAVLFLIIFNLDSVYAKAGALIILIFAQVSDYLDGHLARKHDQITDFGKLFDPLADCVFFITLFGCFTIAGYMPEWMLFMLLFRELMITTFLRPYFSYNKIILSAKMSGKVKTVAQGIAANIIILLIIISQATNIVSEDICKIISFWCMFIVIIFSMYSLIEYLRELKKTN